MVAHTIIKEEQVKDIQEIITNYTVDGEVNWEKVNEETNNHINGIVTKSVAKELEKREPEIVGSFIKELGIEGSSIDDVKLWAKKMGGSTDEFKEKNIKLEKELSELTKNYEFTTKELNEIRSQAQKVSQMNRLISAGLDAEQAEFVQWKLNKQVDDEHTFDSLLETYLKENQPKNNNRFVKQTFDSNKEEIPDSIKKRYPKSFN